MDIDLGEYSKAVSAGPGEDEEGALPMGQRFSWPLLKPKKPTLSLHDSRKVVLSKRRVHRRPQTGNGGGD
jgi:hypothetical protein